MKAREFFHTGKSWTYKAHVWKQVDSMEVDDLIVADTQGNEVERFRMNLNLYSKETGKKFKTKVRNGELYVGRLK